MMAMMTDLKLPDDQANIVSDALAEQIVQESKLYLNVAQGVIVITEDKVRLCLIKHLSRLEARRGWIAPAGILLTIITTFATTTFRDFVLNSDTWKAIFIIAGLLVAAWLIRAIAVALQSPSVEDVVAEMKRASVSEQATSS